MIMAGEEQGNLLVVGGEGSGKSALIRWTLAIYIILANLTKLEMCHILSGEFRVGGK